MIYPLPALLVSCGSTPEDYNLFTVAWAGTICTIRPCATSPYDRNGILRAYQAKHGVCPQPDYRRHGIRHGLVRRAFGRDYRKFEEMKLTPGKARMVAAPIVEESPLNIECRVKEIVSLGSHDMFIAEVLNVKADERYLDEQSGKWSLDASHPLVYLHGLTMAWAGKSVNSVGAWRKRKNEIQLFKVNKNENRHNSI